MLVVTIELYSAVAHRVTLLHRGIIANTGTGTEMLGEYDAAFGGREQERPQAIMQNPERRSVVREFPRKRLNAWHLLSNALIMAGYGSAPRKDHRT